MRYQHHRTLGTASTRRALPPGISFAHAFSLRFLEPVTSVVGMHEGLASMSQISSGTGQSLRDRDLFGGGGQAVDSAQFHSRIIALADALSVAGRDT